MTGSWDIFLDDAPTGPFPAAIRASLTKVINDPMTGEEAEVPNTSSNSPSIATR